MKYEDAEKLSKYIVGANSLLHQSLSDLQESLSKEEYKKLAKEIGVISGEIYLSILRPLWEEHTVLGSEATGGKAIYELDALKEIGKLTKEIPIQYLES